MAKSKPEFRGVSLYKGKAAPVLQKIETIFRLSSLILRLSVAVRRPSLRRCCCRLSSPCLRREAAIAPLLKRNPTASRRLAIVRSRWRRAVIHRSKRGRITRSAMQQRGRGCERARFACSTVRRAVTQTIQFESPRAVVVVLLDALLSTHCRAVVEGRLPSGRRDSNRRPGGAATVLPLQQTSVLPAA